LRFFLASLYSGGVFAGIQLHTNSSATHLRAFNFLFSISELTGRKL